jgi:hypothetical protein
MEQIFCSRILINYTKLDELFKDHAIRSNDIKELVLYIDLETVVKAFYVEELATMWLSKSKKTEQCEVLKMKITSMLINVAGHYRHYFWKKYSKHAVIIYFISTKQNHQYLKINENYKKDFYSKYFLDTVQNELYSKINSIVLASLKLTKLILQYFPGIYYIDLKNKDANIIPYYFITNIIDKVQIIRKNTFNFIFTNNTVLFQLVNQKNSNVVTLTGKHSNLITSANLILHEYSSKNPAGIGEVTSDMYTNILALSGSKKLNIDGVKGMRFVKACKLLSKAILENKISKIAYYDISELANQLYAHKFIEKDHISQIVDNFKLIDLKYIYLNHFSLAKFVEYVNDNIKDKFDGKLIKELNNTIFTDFPLDIEFLTDGQHYKF